MAAAGPAPGPGVLTGDQPESAPGGRRRAVAAVVAEEISHRLVKDFPDDESMRVSHETIYQALYFQARGGFKREVAQHLSPAGPGANRTGAPINAPTGSSTR